MSNWITSWFSCFHVFWHIPRLSTHSCLQGRWKLRRHGLDFPPRALACRVGDTEWRPRDVLHQLAKNEGLKAICERLRYAKKS